MIFQPEALYNSSVEKGISVSCKIRYTTKGRTILGFSCESGCIELYDCELEVSFP